MADNKKSSEQAKSKQKFFIFIFYFFERGRDATFFSGSQEGLVEIENGVDYNVNTHKNNRYTRTTKSGSLKNV